MTNIMDNRPPRSQVDQQFAASLMSDTKWRKLLGALDAAGISDLECRVKFVDVDEPKPMNLSSSGTEHMPYGYVDSLEFGPLPLRAFEWIEVPRSIIHPRYKGDPNGREERQDIDAISRIAAGLGVYPIEMTPQALIIRGYAPR